MSNKAIKQLNDIQQEILKQAAAMRAIVAANKYNAAKTLILNWCHSQETFARKIAMQAGRFSELKSSSTPVAKRSLKQQQPPQTFAAPHRKTVTTPPPAPLNILSAPLHGDSDSDGLDAHIKQQRQLTALKEQAAELEAKFKKVVTQFKELSGKYSKRSAKSKETTAGQKQKEAAEQLQAQSKQLGKQLGDIKAKIAEIEAK